VRHGNWSSAAQELHGRSAAIAHRHRHHPRLRRRAWAGRRFGNPARLSEIGDTFAAMVLSGLRL
jgi:hypothetical protein